MTRSISFSQVREASLIAAMVCALAVPASAADYVRATHIVQKGECIYAIARQYQVGPIALANYNHLSEPYRLSAGEKLLIPWTQVLQSGSPASGSKIAATRDVLYRQPAAPVHTLEVRETPSSTMPSIDRLASKRASEIALRYAKADGWASALSSAPVRADLDLSPPKLRLTFVSTDSDIIASGTAPMSAFPSTVADRSPPDIGALITQTNANAIAATRKISGPPPSLMAGHSPSKPEQMSAPTVASAARSVPALPFVPGLVNVDRSPLDIRSAIAQTHADTVTAIAKPLPSPLGLTSDPPPPVLAGAFAEKSVDADATHPSPSPLQVASTSYDQLHPIADSGLAEMRGGYFLANGAEFDFGASIETLVNGQLALQSTLQWTPQGAVIQQFAGPNAQSTTIPNAEINSVLSALNAAIATNGVTIKAASGTTEVVANLTAGQIQNLLVNTASNQTITQNTAVRLTIYNFSAWQQQVAQQMIGSQLANEIETVSGLMVGH